MITMYEPDGEPSGAAANAGPGPEPAASASATSATSAALAASNASAAGQPSAVAVYDVELVPGTSRAEFVGTVLDRVPAQARYVEAYGDVDLTMRWRTDDRCTLDLLVNSEAAAWRTWRDAERRARDFARLHRRAADSAHAAHSAWQRAVYDLVEQHPSFRGGDDASTRAAEDGPAAADHEQARHAAPGDPPTRRLRSRTEAAAQAMLRRIDQERARNRDAPPAEPDLDRPRRRTGHDQDAAGSADPIFDPDRDGYEEALASWHAAADRDGIDVPLGPGEEAVELTADGGAVEAEPDGGQ